MAIFQVLSLDSLDPKTFLTPFLDVIRSEAVTGSVTGMALDSVHKFLSYQILHPDMPEVATAVENLADAVTHARFVGPCRTTYGNSHNCHKKGRLDIAIWK